jgi:hypothetical protein
MMRLRQVLSVGLAAMLAINLAVAASDAKPAKSRGRRPPPAAVDTTRLRGALSDPFPPPGPLDPPAAPQRPQSPRPPQSPLAPSVGIARLSGDPASECRQVCNTKRSQCITQEASNCDSAWSTCVIDCNLPSGVR